MPWHTLSLTSYVILTLAFQMGVFCPHSSTLSLMVWASLKSNISSLAFVFYVQLICSAACYCWSRVEGGPSGGSSEIDSWACSEAVPFPRVVSCWRIWKTCLCSMRKLWRIWKTCLYSHKEAYVSMFIVPVPCFYLCITLFVKTDVENATKLLPSLTGFLIALFPFHRRIVTFQGLLWTTIVMIYLIFGVQCTFKRVWQSMTEYVPSANLNMFLVLTRHSLALDDQCWRSLLL